MRTAHKFLNVCAVGPPIIRTLVVPKNHLTEILRSIWSWIFFAIRVIFFPSFMQSNFFCTSCDQFLSFLLALSGALACAQRTPFWKMTYHKILFEVDFFFASLNLLSLLCKSNIFHRNPKKVTEVLCSIWGKIFIALRSIFFQNLFKNFFALRAINFYRLFFSWPWYEEHCHSPQGRGFSKGGQKYLIPPQEDLISEDFRRRIVKI